MPRYYLGFSSELMTVSDIHGGRLEVLWAMMRHMIVVLSCLSASSLAFGQEEIHHHNVTAGVGAGIPVGATTNYLGAAPLFSIGYGYRFNRFFQADAGAQFAFGAAHNQNAEITDFGPVQGGDHEYMIPLGGRVYIPQPFKRIEVSTGGGAMYLHYSETISSNGDGFSANCYSCTSRGGWGGYGMANVSYFLDSNRTFRIGSTVQLVSASTNGQAVGNIPSLKTTDHWTNVLFQFGFSF
jgi:hypothetical protein